MTSRLNAILSCLQGNYEEWARRRFAASWYCAERRERKARLQAIVELSVELEKIRAVSNFSTALGEAAIGDVIDGDWQSVKMWADSFTFAHEGGDIEARYRPLWERFRDLLVCAAASADARGKGRKAA